MESKLALHQISAGILCSGTTTKLAVNAVSTSRVVVTLERSLLRL